jgi:uncharacterized protein YndB with AHSA1/START domain
MNTDCVTITTVVTVDPAAAFDIFTSEIAAWWSPKVRGMFQPGCDGTLSFQEGRLVETYDNHATFDIGRVLDWEPPERLAFEWRQEGFAPGERTEVEVLFEAIAEGTRVTVRHSRWDTFPAGHPARHGYTGTAFSGMIGLRWADALTGLRHAPCLSQRLNAK